MSRKNQPEKDRKGRGGYRDNAGRKSSWKHSDTCTIRIPKSFAKLLVEIARQLDNGEKIDIDTKSIRPDSDSVTESILNLDESTLSQSIPELKVAIVQAKNILKAKKSARRSLARLLSTLYSTTVSFDDLK